MEAQELAKKIKWPHPLTFRSALLVHKEPSKFSQNNKRLNQPFKVLHWRGFWSNLENAQASIYKWVEDDKNNMDWISILRYKEEETFEKTRKTLLIVENDGGRPEEKKT